MAKDGTNRGGARPVPEDRERIPTEQQNTHRLQQSS